MQEIISGRMSDRVLLCMWRLSIKLLSKKKLLAGGRCRNRLLVGVDEAS